MPQVGRYTRIVVYKSETANEVPSATRLGVGELAINIADAKIYTKNTAEEIIDLSGGNSHTHVAGDITNFDSSVFTSAQASLRPSIYIDDSTAYTLQASRESGVILFTNAAAITVTVPNNSTVPLPAGYIVHLHQKAAGQITVVGAADVVVSSAISLKTRVRHSSLSLIKVDAVNDWQVIGDQEIPV